MKKGIKVNIGGRDCRIPIVNDANNVASKLLWHEIKILCLEENLFIFTSEIREMSTKIVLGLFMCLFVSEVFMNLSAYNINDFYVFH